MARSASDVLSLTLPKARARLRWKRPKLPGGWFWWLLFWTAYCTVFAVIDVLNGQVLVAALQTAGAVFYWRHTIRALDGIVPPSRSFLAFAGAWFAILLVFALLGVPGA
jgi:hypothetical protein